jgi:hypothetical protein
MTERKGRQLLPDGLCRLCGVPVEPDQEPEPDGPGRVVHGWCRGAQIDSIIARGRTHPDYPGPV